jgi:hypothetical protein
MTSLPTLLKDRQVIIELACFMYLIILIMFLVVVALLFRYIISSQPWIVWLLRTIYEFTLKVLYIPLITIPISSFDCHLNESGKLILHGSNLSCAGGDALQIITMILCIVHLILLLVFSTVINMLIFSHNPKHGGIFTAPTGVPGIVLSTLTFGLVFAMRLLWDWWFWRGVVTVGASVFLVAYYTYLQPYYRVRYA